MISFEPLSTWDPDFVSALRRHYTGSLGPPPGRKLAWRIVEGGVLVRGYIGLSEPSFKLAARRRLGLDDARPLPGTASNFIFRLEAAGAIKASQILRAWIPVAEAEWLRRYDESLVHLETMIDPSKTTSPVVGACYRRAGFRHIGQTTGRMCRRPAAGEGAGAHGSTSWPSGGRQWGQGSVKQVFYRGPLARLASPAPLPKLR